MDPDPDLDSVSFLNSDTANEFREEKFYLVSFITNKDEDVYNWKVSIRFLKDKMENTESDQGY